MSKVLSELKLHLSTARLQTFNRFHRLARFLLNILDVLMRPVFLPLPLQPSHPPPPPPPRPTPFVLADQGIAPFIDGSFHSLLLIKPC